MAKIFLDRPPRPGDGKGEVEINGKLYPKSECTCKKDKNGEIISNSWKLKGDKS